MGVTNLWPLGLLILVPAIVLLYILKKKYKSEEISSLMLWQEVYKNTVADTPWEKLKTNIMMFIQILIVIFLVFSLMNPFFNFGGHKYKNIIIVIDNTASMSAIYEKDITRLEKAKDIATEYIGSINYEVNSTIIEYDGKNNNTVPQIEDIKQAYGSGDICEILSYVRSLGEEYGNYEVLLVSDKAVDLGNINGKAVCLGSLGKNAAITNISHKFNNDSLKVISVITNTGKGAYEGDFSLYSDSQLLDVKRVNLKEGASITFEYEFKNYKGAYLKGELAKEDYIAGDNTYYDIVKQSGEKKILLVTNKNVFLEKSLSSIENSQVYKANSIENAAYDNYDLYVFDNVTPKNMPKSGNILFINPDSNEYFNVHENNSTEEVNGADDVLSKYTSKMKFTVCNYKTIDMPHYGKAIMKCNNENVGFIGDSNERIICALGFDIHNSDIALKKEFPILIYELGQKLTATGILNRNNYSGADNITINSSPKAEGLQITGPDGYKEKLTGSSIIKDATALGIYNVKENLSDGQIINDQFSINYPSNESIFDKENISESNNLKTENKILRKGLSITPVILLIALIGIIAEYILYLRGK